ncbi:hypothetical protein ON010_g1071 [Phytophthora cinnamomi]|nr:hypothetical protein ON010_g1071 [Phytophthora cinnamomi]
MTMTTTGKIPPPPPTTSLRPTTALKNARAEWWTRAPRAPPSSCTVAMPTRSASTRAPSSARAGFTPSAPCTEPTPTATSGASTCANAWLDRLQLWCKHCHAAYGDEQRSDPAPAPKIVIGRDTNYCPAAYPQAQCGEDPTSGGMMVSDSVSTAGVSTASSDKRQRYIRKPN